MVNASGDLYAVGDGPDGDGWYVGANNPFAPDPDLAVLCIHDRGVATSGSIKRHWTTGTAATIPSSTRASANLRTATC